MPTQGQATQRLCPKPRGALLAANAENPQRGYDEGDPCARKSPAKVQELPEARDHQGNEDGKGHHPDGYQYVQPPSEGTPCDDDIGLLLVRTTAACLADQIAIELPVGVNVELEGH